MPALSDGRPRNIVLFADGTGNSASKPFKTNVWRTYQALDLTPSQSGDPSQVAYYRDGVGTETFKPMKLLGGAFGFGVMRHVRALYVFLCRNYRPGDRIYAFGFSRGAFTIRLLVGLVAKCGAVQAQDENELYHFTNAAYAAFRRDFLIRASRKHGMVYDQVIAPPCYRADGDTIDLHLPTEPLWPRIAFLGLWDTVDAYGMPVEELKQGIDEWIWPMRLADRKLAAIVDHACHALSLDDERPTFRPVLWDESDPADAARLEQVWFSGVHANVGGGYPIDDLAFVPLLWMLDKASAAGLRFCPDIVKAFTELENVHGTAYDSRSGVAGYYRYGPRSLEKLCRDPRNGVAIARLRVHESVAERIAQRQVAYAPLSLPRVLPLDAPDGGGPVGQDSAYVDYAWDAVFRRRITYFATLGLTFVLLLGPFFATHHVDAPGSDWPDAFLPRPLAAFVGKIVGFVPAWAAPWLDALEYHAEISVPLVSIFLWLFFVESGRLQRTIAERSEWAWAALKGTPAQPAPTPGWTDRLVRAVRMSPSGNAIGRWYDQKLVPNVVGLGLLGLIVWAATSLLLKLFFALTGRWLALATLLSLTLASVGFLRNASYRKMIDAQLETAGDPALRIPERRLSYGAEDLARFKAAAAAVVLPDRRTLLEVYHGPVLLPNDLVVALALGAFVILLGRWLALGVPGLHWLFHASAVFGLLYAGFDVAEDILLARIFGSRGVPAGPARIVPWMTRGKMVCLVASVTGGLVFAALTLASRSIKAVVPRRF